MTSWIVPALAAAFWAGAILWPALGRLVTPWEPLVAGLIVLALALARAPRRRADDRLAAAGLVTSREIPALAALETGTQLLPRAPPALVAAGLVLAFVMLGAGWTGIRIERIVGSPLSRGAPAAVTVTGALLTDPQPGPFGWSAQLGVSEARVHQPWSQADAVLRVAERVWVEGSDRIPRVRRGDRSSARPCLARRGPGRPAGVPEHGRFRTRHVATARPRLPLLRRRAAAHGVTRHLCRSARPGFSPVGLPASSVSLPFTSTYSIPSP